MISSSVEKDPMRFVVPALLVFVASCSAPPEAKRQQPGPIVPEPVAATDTPREVTALLTGLGSEDFSRRENATGELLRIGQDPVRQPAVVAALRSAATSSDPEVRLRARETLKRIDRSESIVPSTDRPDSPTMYRFSGAGFQLQCKFWHRLFADGSSELEVELNGAPRELFSGSTPAELASRVNEAARKHGYTPEEFRMLDDGGMKFGGSTLSGGNQSQDHLIREWGLWVSRASRADGLTPPVVWGGWVVQARALSGRAFDSGIQLRDVILEVDGKKAQTVQELRDLLHQPRKVALVRAEARRVVIEPK
jgi:hypothetical protein